MNKNKLLVKVTSILTALSLLVPMFPVATAAAAGTSGRVKWTGHALKDAPADVWDGVTYDTSWYTPTGGTEDDPYIIRDADDLAGLAALMIDSSYDGQSYVTNAWTSGKHLYDFDAFTKPSQYTANLPNNLTIMAGNPYDANSYYSTSSASWSRGFPYGLGNVTLGRVRAYYYRHGDLSTGHYSDFYYVTDCTKTLRVGSYTETINTYDYFKRAYYFFTKDYFDTLPVDDVYGAPLIDVSDPKYDDIKDGYSITYCLDDYNIELCANNLSIPFVISYDEDTDELKASILETGSLGETLYTKELTHFPCSSAFTALTLTNANGDTLDWSVYKGYEMLAKETYGGFTPVAATITANPKLVPNIVNDGHDVTFAGKYIKLAANIDMGERLSSFSIFPFASNSDYGFSGHFDGDGHYIIGDYNAKNMFGTINSDGSMSNIVLVPRNRLGYGIQVNAGAISNVEYMHYETFKGNTIFEKGDMPSYDTAGGMFYRYGVPLTSYTDPNILYAIGTNLGIADNVTVQNSLIFAAGLAENGSGFVNDSAIYFIDAHLADDMKADSSSTAFRQIHYTAVGCSADNILIDADSDELGTKSDDVVLQLKGMFAGTAKNVTIAEFTLGKSRQNMDVLGDAVFDNLDYNLSTKRITPEFMPSGIGTGAHTIGKNAVILNSTIKGHDDFFTGLGFSRIENSVIDITVNGDRPDAGGFDSFIGAIMGGGYASGIPIYDSDVHIHLTRPYGSKETGLSSYPTIHAKAVNSKISVTAEDETCLFSNGGDEIISGTYKNCDMYVENYVNVNHTTMFAANFIDSNIKFVNAQNSDVSGNIMGIFGSGGLQNTSFYLDLQGGRMPSMLSIGGKCCVDSDLHINIGGTVSQTGHFETTGEVENTNIIYTFDDDASGFIPLPTTGVSMKNGMLYIDKMPESLVLSHNIIGGNNTGYVKDSVIIAPHLTVRGGAEYGVFITKQGYCDIENSYVDVGLYSNSDEPIKGVTAVSAPTGTIGSNLVFNIDVFNKNGTPSDTPVNCIYPQGHSPVRQFNNIAFTSNTKSGNSHVAVFAQDAINTHFAAPIIMHSVYMDLPNQSKITPSATVEGYTPGVFGFTERVTVSSQPWDEPQTTEPITLAPAAKNAAASSLMHYMTYGIGNVVVPEGQSVVSQVYVADTDTPDSWNISEKMGTLFPASYWTAQPEGTLDGAPIYSEYPKGVETVSSRDAKTSGEVAYLLDNGASNRRTYEWTVLDKLTLVDPVTDKVLCEYPKHLTLTSIPYNSRMIKSVDSLSGELEQTPFFKMTVTKAERGEVDIIGFDKQPIHEGSTYAKQNSVLGGKARVYDSKTIFVYATQQFRGSKASRIPSTNGKSTGLYAMRAAGDYTIEGYRAQGMDTIITPVFKTARNITVDISDDEHGTVIPSAYVTAEGEKITLEYNVDAGYRIANLRIEGPTTSRLLTDNYFLMPDEDITIKGECVPFKAGIEEFSIWGFKGEIDQFARTILVKLPRVGDITNVLPSIKWTGETLSPSDKTRVDFTNPVTYTVTYANGTKTMDYVVTVVQSDYTMRIYDFVVDGVHGDINQATRTIEVVLPSNTDITAITPEYIGYSAETITPAENAEQDFRATIPYTLNAAGMTSVTYLVTVKAADDTTAEINEYKVSGYDGIIVESDTAEDPATPSTITINVPLGSDLSNIEPDIIQFRGRRIEPSRLTLVDLSEGTEQTYAVYNQLNTPRFYNVRANYVADDTARITRFVLGGYDGQIDEKRKEIFVRVPDGTTLVGVAPDVLTYEGKSIYPSITAPQDFTSDDVTYTVVAQNNREVTYRVLVGTSPAELIRFEVLGYPGIIDNIAKTVKIVFPYGIDPSNTPPSEVAISYGATISPSADAPNDFTVPQQYTVTSEDGLNSNTYTVYPFFEDAFDNRITRFVLDGVDGVIKDIGDDLGTIHVTINKHAGMPDLSNIVPDNITVSEGAVLAPDDTTAGDFSNTKVTPVIYTVTGTNSGTRTYYVYVEVVSPDTTAKITQFEINGHPGIIEQPDEDGERGVITVYIPVTERPDITDVQPVIIWEGETITPSDNNDPQDFSDPANPVVYTVVAQDPDYYTNYEVIITYVECIISEFEVCNIPAVIDQDAKTIKVTVPYNYGDAIKNTVPTKITWIGDNLTPNDTTAQDFSAPVTYTVMKDAPLEIERVWKNYEVTVTVADKPVTPPTPPGPTPRPTNPTPTPGGGTDPKITEFWLSGVKGTIDQTMLAITVRLPKGTDVTDIAPDKVLYIGDKLEPTAKEKQDFTKFTLYTVSAGTKSKTYTVQVIFDDVLDTDCKIIQYIIGGVNSDIDQETGIITAKLPRTYLNKLSSLAPDKVVWIGDMLTPTETEVLDFTSPVKYRVYAQNRDYYKDYTVYLTIADDTECAIISYTLGGVAGNIDQSTGKITITLPYTFKGKTNNLTPDEIVWIGDTLTPDETSAQDFTKPVAYRVYAEDHAYYKDYMVYVTVKDPDGNPNTGAETTNALAVQQELMWMLTASAFALGAFLARKKREEN